MSLGIIGGSGVYSFDSIKVLEEISIETPFGFPSSKIIKAKLNDNELYFLPRHGKGHKISPSEINYRANIYALKKLGITHVLSISAVGSLREDLAPGDFFLPDQFIDWTKGKRERSFFSNGMVGHVSAANPVCNELRNRVYTLSQELSSLKTTTIGSYICIEGPQFSTKAESQIYRGFGASVIGMTNVPEAYLAKEAGLAYATVAMITDYDCWKEEHCTVDEIMKVMKGNYNNAQKLIELVVPSLCDNPTKVTKENEYAVITKPELLSAKQLEIIEVLKQ